ncbi:TPA: ABC transporter ATP-binding protein [Salmonella enterica subsp. enterica serovar Typhimurium var. 5-]|uniref:Multidrug resistance-like ATP-binding protein MdlB n=1 Tax=Salmonella enterica subsp. enterica serovar Typhimurium var. 5- TaxID=1620419 RepID=A0A740PV90_SALTM|nr:ABC transporter ATP-binding protein [Salmonella enterica subsp. enterica serovar Typhimurium var. 5-]
MKTLIFYIKQLFSYSGSILYWNIFGMAIISFFEGMSILMLIPILSLTGILDLNQEADGLLATFDFFQSLPESLNLPLVLLLYILLIGLQNLIDRNLSVRNVKINHGFIGRVRITIYEALMNANWGFYSRKRKSDLVNIMTIELARVSGGIYQFIKLLTAIIFCLIQVCFAFWLSVEMTLFVLMSGIILSFFSQRFIRQSKALGKRTSKLSQEYLAGITDQLNGIKDIKSNILEESRINWLRSIVHGMYEEQIDYIKLKISSQLLYKMASTILIALFIFFSYKMFNSQPGQFLLIVVIFSRLWPRITGIQTSIEQLATTLPAFEALNNLRLESMEAAEIKIYGNKDAVKPLVLNDSIKCENVFFRYDKSLLKFALNNVNLSIPSNQMTAIVGRSGAGKSTLIDILMGLHIPEKGQVLIDNEQIGKENLISLRKAISYVPQDPFLFNLSIKENFKLIDNEITTEQIWEALEFAAAADFVRLLPNGLDTEIGERGFKLSGGERQRLVLARAILKKPSILILDEATSALDTENESEIQKSLDHLKGKMTIIVIAHRLSTIRHADKVIVMDNGCVIQSGEYGKLANDANGVFNGLLKKQEVMMSS